MKDARGFTMDERQQRLRQEHQQLANKLLLDVLDAYEAKDTIEISRALGNLKDAVNHGWPLAEMPSEVPEQYAHLTGISLL